MKQSKIEEQKYKYEKYLEERKLLIDAEREAARSFDQYMLTLAAGALGLSITFVREIAPHPIELNLLYIAWTGFALSLVSTLVSFLSGQKAIRNQRSIMDEWYRTEGESEDHTRNSWATVTNIFNFTSMIVFMIGVIFLALFAATNLK